MNRDQQFKIIERAEKDIMNWAKSQDINMHNIEFVVPFVKDDFSLHAIFFYIDNKVLKRYSNNGISEKVKDKFIRKLKESDYPKEHIKEARFEFDSYENVLKNYKGNYFYRMR